MSGLLTRLDNWSKENLDSLKLCPGDVVAFHNEFLQYGSKLIMTRAKKPLREGTTSKNPLDLCLTYVTLFDPGKKENEILRTSTGIWYFSPDKPIPSHSDELRTYNFNVTDAYVGKEEIQKAFDSDVFKKEGLSCDSDWFENFSGKK